MVGSPAGGELVWAFEPPNERNQGEPRVVASPTVVDGTAYVGSDDGHLYAVATGVDGDSEGSRVRLGTLGHHHDRAPELSVPREVGGLVDTVTDVARDEVDRTTDRARRSTGHRIRREVDRLVGARVRRALERIVGSRD